MTKIKGVIDPGHGGIDRSNKGPTGYIEADGMLRLSYLIMNKLNATGHFNVILTRYKDETVSLLKRTNIAKDFGADFFLSEHTNAFSTPEVGGVEAYYSVARPLSKELAEAICYRISTELEVSNRGAQVKLNTSKTDYYGILRYGSNAGIQNVFIIESLFHSNPREEQMLKDEKTLDLIADIQAEEVCRFYGFAYKKEDYMSMTLEQKVDKLWKEVFGEVAPNPTPLPTTRPTISRGMINDDVKYAQSLMNKDGFTLVEDGSFGPGTERAVKGFQKRYSLLPSGVVESATWSKLESVTEGKEPIYRKLRRFSSDIHVLEINPKYYHVDFEVGELWTLEQPTKIANDLRAKGVDVVAITNFGFFIFGSGREHLGSWIDDGKYYQPPSADFIDVIYYKNGKLDIHNYDGYDGPLLSSLQKDAYWMGGLSYSLVQNGVINLENSSKYSHATQRHPRMMIGQKANGNLLLVAADGRTLASLGLTAQQSAEVMLELGARDAANGDGGGSVTMASFDGEKVVVINKPSDQGNERKIGSTLVVRKL